MSWTRGAIAALTVLAGVACEKVPIYNVSADFLLADAAWFEAEETLFLFYEVTAEQGIGDPSVIEVTYTTDDGVIDWTAITELEPVHTHLPVDCGSTTRCGSMSLRVPLEPRDVDFRLRYHRDGELALGADTILNVVGEGEPYEGRSLIVYGVFDASNRWLQWRGRHQFPTLRNGQVQKLGLRRTIVITEQAYGTETLDSGRNPYGYGARCPSDFEAVGLDAVETNARAIFNPEELPNGASSAAVVCAQATVTDATGTFSTGAIARKNPELRSAFPVLRSPVYEATPLPFFLAPCERNISASHAGMQRQRLLMDNEPTYCIDDWDSPGFVDALAAELGQAVEAARPDGDDMVLVIGLHQDEEGASEAVEAALDQIVPEERHRASPRLAGAFVFDSVDRRLQTDSLSMSTLWCPSRLPGLDDLSSFPDASVRTCPILPDLPEVELGPFSFSSLPILAPRDQYLDFINTYSAAQAGETTGLQFLTPEFATTAEHFDYGDYGVVTFLNEENFSADADDAFSYCVQDSFQIYAFRTPFLQSGGAVLLKKLCESGELPDELCELAALGLLPIELLPDWHNQLGEDRYELGLFWDFPFLTRMEYETVNAGSVDAFGLTVPFGFAQDGESYFGTALWTQDVFSLEDLLTHCRRFCDHPTFDSAGVYHVTDPFRTTYANSCYQPTHPALGDSGFPRDP
jgi:hypothetical protein